ncbi:penicillin-binding protein 2 [Patescibacteria group bacterium]|nr:penicillin-binding protein 2 [Patescibacteria group bacterium]
MALVKLLFFVVALTVSARLFYIQIIQHKQFVALAETQHWQHQKIPAQRGQILTSDYYPLATDQEAYDFFIITSEFKLKSDAELPVDKLVDLFIEGKVWKKDSVDERKKQLQNNLQDPQISWLLVEKQINLSLKDKIENLFNGIYFKRHNRREYPEGTLASHLLGFVGANTTGEDQGYFGLEGYYHADLAGKPGWVALEIDALGNPIPVGEYISNDPENGRDLILTINRDLQFVLEKKLETGVKQYGAKSGTFILASPFTGEILALANYPNFNPTTWAKDIISENDKDIFSNLAISQSFEPGSVLKTVIMAAALNENIVQPSSSFTCDGPLTIQGHQIKTWNNQYHGTETMAEILQHSCNVGAAWLSHEVGQEMYFKYLTAFKLGEKMGIDLEGEANGIVKPQTSWRQIDLATAAFGQGISVTPIQLVTIFSTIANNGVRANPFIVEKIIAENREIPLSPPKQERVLAEKTTFKLKRMLQDVVEKGEFKWFVKQAGLDKFAIAGKTGTAQIPRQGRYDPNKTNVTFVGFSPVNDPIFVLLVKLEEPSSSTYSAETAIPLWLEMARELIIYFGITPKQ